MRLIEQALAATARAIVGRRTSARGTIHSRMGSKEPYLVRGPDGRMTTVIAQSVDGAKRAYLYEHRLAKGSQFSIKPRGWGDWTYFDVI